MNISLVNNVVPGTSSQGRVVWERFALAWRLVNHITSIGLAYDDDHRHVVLVASADRRTNKRRLEITSTSL